MSGRPDEFARLEALRNQRPKALGKFTSELQLKRTLAKRDLRGFTKIISAFKNASGLLNYTRTYISYIFGDDAVSSAPLDAYTKTLLTRLKQLNVPGTTEEDEINEFALLLDPTKSAWLQAGQSVHKGVIKLGVAQWTHGLPRPPSFALHPPQVMPRRELFYVPLAGGGERGWKFSTAIR